MGSFKIIPIKSNELPKFLLTSFMMVLVLYVYTILRGTKDTLIVPDPELGAELLSALKLYGVLPCAVLFMLLYTKLADHFTKIQIFHFFNWLFISFFIFYDLVLYPAVPYIHFDFSNIYTRFPFLKYILIMAEYWPASLFYIMSELWGSMMIALLFWQLANQINTIDEAKRFYPLFILLGQLGAITAGSLLVIFNRPSIASDWSSPLHYICFSVFISGILLSLTFYILSNHVVGNDIINGTQSKTTKKKIGLIASLKYILTSKYIGLITLLILCYGVSINLVEAVWKKQAGYLYPEAIQFASFMGKVHVYTGITTLISMLAGSVILQIFSWRIAALATPAVILITGIPFFLFIIFSDWISNYLATSDMDILYYAVMLGALQNILSKAIKHSFFDSTKEIAYIPLDEELKTKGKAAADVVGGRLGKSGGAVIQQVMLSFIFGSTLLTLALPLFIIFVLVMIIWFIAVKALYKEFKAKTTNITGY